MSVVNAGKWKKYKILQKQKRKKGGTVNQLDHVTTITKEIFIECRPETLFSFFTDPDKMVRWIGRQILLEPRIGGKYRN